jgi:hypothetical protein
MDTTRFYTLVWSLDDDADRSEPWVWHAWALHRLPVLYRLVERQYQQEEDARLVDAPSPVLTLDLSELDITSKDVLLALQAWTYTLRTDCLLALVPHRAALTLADVLGSDALARALTRVRWLARVQQLREPCGKAWSWLREHMTARNTGRALAACFITWWRMIWVWQRIVALLLLANLFLFALRADSHLIPAMRALLDYENELIQEQARVLHALQDPTHKYVVVFSDPHVWKNTLAGAVQDMVSLLRAAFAPLRCVCYVAESILALLVFTAEGLIVSIRVGVSASAFCTFHTNNNNTLYQGTLLTQAVLRYVCAGQ